MAYSVDQATSGDHGNESGLGRHRFVESAGILPDVDEDLLHGVFCLLRIAEHLAGDRPYEPSIFVYARLNRCAVSRGDRM